MNTPIEKAQIPVRRCHYGEERFDNGISPGTTACVEDLPHDILNIGRIGEESTAILTHVSACSQGTHPSHHLTRE